MNQPTPPPSPDRRLGDDTPHGQQGAPATARLGARHLRRRHDDQNDEGIRRRRLADATPPAEWGNENGGGDTPPPLERHDAPHASPPAKSGKGNMRQRVLSGGIVVALFVSGLFFLPPYAPLVPILVFGLVAGGVLEFCRMLELANKEVTYGLVPALGISAALWLAAWEGGGSMAWVLAIGMMLSHCVNLFYGRASHYSSRVALNSFAVVYVALPLCLLLNLHSDYVKAVAEGTQNFVRSAPEREFDKRNEAITRERILLDRHYAPTPETYPYPHLPSSIVLFFLLMVWANDTGAFFTGKNFGGKVFGDRKLAPRISPNKTIEGLWGGILSTLLVSYCVPKFGLLPGIDAVFHSGPWNLFGGFLIACAVPIGDLAESALKREVGVKDSGSFLPGHGGVLDRIDSMLFAAPIYVALCHAFGPPVFFAFPK